MATLNTQAHVAELAAKIRPVHSPMFATIDPQGHLVAQPMRLQQTDDEGGLWFFTSTLTELWGNIAPHPEVNLSFADQNEGLYVSVSGTAERVVDRNRIRELWNPFASAWFPNGPDEEHVVLVRVVPHAAEYWDTTESRMVRMFQIAQAALGGKPPETKPGEHGMIPLQEPGQAD